MTGHGADRPSQNGRPPMTAPTAYTVTICTPIHHDGEASFVYVVTANTAARAINLALAVCAREQELLAADGQIATDTTGESFRRVENVTAGIPARDRGYVWNDRRDTSTRTTAR